MAKRDSPAPLAQAKQERVTENQRVNLCVKANLLVAAD